MMRLIYFRLDATVLSLNCLLTTHHRYREPGPEPDDTVTPGLPSDDPGPNNLSMTRFNALSSKT